MQSTPVPETTHAAELRNTAEEKGFMLRLHYNVTEELHQGRLQIFKDGLKVQVHEPRKNKKGKSLSMPVECGGVSKAEMCSSMAAETGLMKMPYFGSAFSAQFDEIFPGDQKTFLFATRQVFEEFGTLKLEEQPSQFLTDEFKTDLEQLKPLEFVEKWGTMYICSMILGARVTYALSSPTKETTFPKKLLEALDAKVTEEDAALMALRSGGQVTFKELSHPLALKQEEMTCSILVEGGQPDLWHPDSECSEDWKKSVPEAPVICKVMYEPIWKLVEGQKADDLQKAAKIKLLKDGRPKYDHKRICGYAGCEETPQEKELWCFCVKEDCDHYTHWMHRNCFIKAHGGGCEDHSSPDFIQNFTLEQIEARKTTEPRLALARAFSLYGEGGAKALAGGLVVAASGMGLCDAAGALGVGFLLETAVYYRQWVDHELTTREFKTKLCGALGGACGAAVGGWVGGAMGAGLAACAGAMNPVAVVAAAVIGSMLGALILGYAGRLAAEAVADRFLSDEDDELRAIALAEALYFLCLEPESIIQDSYQVTHLDALYRHMAKDKHPDKKCGARKRPDESQEQFDQRKKDAEEDFVVLVHHTMVVRTFIERRKTREWTNTKSFEGAKECFNQLKHGLRKPRQDIKLLKQDVPRPEALEN